MTSLPLTPTVAAPPSQPPRDAAPRGDAALHDAARKLEATFLAEMLKSAGLGETRGAFGGGTGAEQFASFLRRAQAEEMVKAGGIGLSESLFEALKERRHEK